MSRTMTSSQIRGRRKSASARQPKGKLFKRWETQHAHGLTTQWECVTRPLSECHTVFGSNQFNNANRTYTNLKWGEFEFGTLLLGGFLEMWWGVNIHCSTRVVGTAIETLLAATLQTSPPPDQSQSAKRKFHVGYSCQPGSNAETTRLV